MSRRGVNATHMTNILIASVSWNIMTPETIRIYALRYIIKPIIWLVRGGCVLGVSIKRYRSRHWQLYNQWRHVYLMPQVGKDKWAPVIQACKDGISAAYYDYHQPEGCIIIGDILREDIREIAEKNEWFLSQKSFNKK